MRIFADRKRAGQELGRLLASSQPELIAPARRKELIVLGLARGGLPVAREVSIQLGCEFDAVLVRKLGLPSQPELAFGAISEAGSIWRNELLIARSGLTEVAISKVLLDEQAELDRRTKLYRGNRELPSLDSKTVILVDDGIATGATMHAAVEFVRSQKPAAIYIAVPVATIHSKMDFAPEVAGFFCLNTPSDFGSVGEFYEDFSQVRDSEVLELLDK